MTIYETLKADGAFEVLATAMDAGGLRDILDDDGPYTVFGPTDDAFSRLSDDEFAELTGNADRLAETVAYHVVIGKFRAADVVRMRVLDTLLGVPLAVDAERGVRIDGTRVTDVDIAASNGVIHGIARVLEPAALLRPAA